LARLLINWNCRTPAALIQWYMCPSLRRCSMIIFRYTLTRHPLSPNSRCHSRFCNDECDARALRWSLRYSCNGLVYPIRWRPRKTLMPFASISFCTLGTSEFSRRGDC
jgi:hypothetical protein